MNELQLRVVLGLVLPFMALAHAVWANQPAIFLVALTIGLVWASTESYFGPELVSMPRCCIPQKWVSSCLSAMV